MIQTRDHQDHPEEKDDSADGSAEQEDLFQEAVRSKPLDHGSNPPPDVVFVGPVVGTIASYSRT
jgi:hypothetical protein